MFQTQMIMVVFKGDAPCDEEVKDDEQLSEDEESIMMSQRVWDDIDQHAPGSGDERATDEQDSHVASQRWRYAGTTKSGDCR